MPRSWPLSAIASSTEITAPQALASTTPESSSRPESPPLPIQYTIAPIASAPPVAVHSSAPSVNPASMPASAPTEAPPETPSTKGSASGLRNRACSSTPASASRLPTANAEIARGSRIVRTIVPASSSPPPPSAASVRSSESSAEPARSDASRQARPSSPSSVSIHICADRVIMCSLSTARGR